jgi:hypothetical protein
MLRELRAEDGDDTSDRNDPVGEWVSSAGCLTCGPRTNRVRRCLATPR